MSQGIRERVNERLLKMTLWGDSIGGINQRLNYEYINEMLPNVVAAVEAGAYGAQKLVLASHVKGSDLNELIALMEQFEPRVSEDVTNTFGWGQERRQQIVIDRVAYLYADLVRDHFKYDWPKETGINWDSTILVDAEPEQIAAAILAQEPEVSIDTATDVWVHVTPGLYKAVVFSFIDAYAHELHERYVAGATPIRNLVAA